MSAHIHLPTQQLQHSCHAIFGKQGQYIVTMSQEGVTQGDDAAMTINAIPT